MNTGLNILFFLSLLAWIHFMIKQHNLSTITIRDIKTPKAPAPVVEYRFYRKRKPVKYFCREHVKSLRKYELCVVVKPEKCIDCKKQLTPPTI